MNNNLITCVSFCIILIAILFYYIIGCDSLYNSNNYDEITPQTFVNMFSLKNIAIVNTLSNDFLLNTYPTNTNNSYGKSFIDKQNIKKFDKIILYCANYTCGASHKYAKELINKGYKKHNIILYGGGIHEWAKYSILYPSNFNIYDKNTQLILKEAELRKIISDFSHFSENKKHTKYGKKYPELILENSANDNFYNNLRIPRKNKCNSNYNSNLLENKVCVVTGGTSGLGLTVVYMMLNNGAKHVTLTYFNNDERANKVNNELSKQFNKNRFYVLKADARTTEGNLLTFDANLRKTKLNLDTGGINCVDINAGIFGPANFNKKHVHNISETDYKKVIDINLNGYFLAIKYFVRQAIENNISDGSIVCIKSIYGSTGSLFSNIAYQTSKHGVMGLVRQSAVELARANEKIKLKFPIRVNAVSPTFTNTALTEPMLKTNIINETLKNSNTLGNLADKNDIANAVIYLLSDNSKSITGIDLPVDCGVLAESIPTYEEVLMLNDEDIEELSCCGSKL